MAMLDFIYMGSADLFRTGREGKIQNENICFQRDSIPHHDRKVSALDRSATLVRYQVVYLKSNSILIYEYKWICDNTCNESVMVRYPMQSPVNSYYTR